MRVRSLSTSRDDHHNVEAEVVIDAPVSAVWNVLTDYDSLSEFIPGMTESRLIERGADGTAIVEQKGALSIFPRMFERRLVLQVQENPMKNITFRMQEGDFESYEGQWKLRNAGGTVRLSVSIVAAHPTGLPRFLVAHSLKKAAKRSLLAIAREAEKRHAEGTSRR